MGVAKIIELVGGSEEGFEEAVQNALKRAEETVRGIHGVQVEGFTVTVEDGEVSEYRADVKISFEVEK